jgi:hypothetical protein
MLLAHVKRRVQSAAEYAMKRLKTMLPRNTPPRMDKKYPTFIVMTAIILCTRQPARCQTSRLKTYNKYPTAAMVTSMDAETTAS